MKARNTQSSEKPESYRCLVCGTKQLKKFEYHNYSYYKCSRCGLVTTLPIPDGETIENHYRKKFKQGNYELLRKFNEEYKNVYRQFVNILHKQLPDNKQTFSKKKVLDIGCFTGEFLELMNEAGADVYGVELQDTAVKIANKKLPGRIFQADIFSDNLPKKKYDIITLLGLIEHVVNPDELLKRVYDLMNKDGIIMLQTPNSGSFFAKTMGKFWPPYAPVEHIHLFSRGSLESLLKKTGFKEITFQAHYKPLPIAYVYNMLHNYGPEFRPLFKPMYSILPEKIKQSSIHFYIGEMIITARKK